MNNQPKPTKPSPATDPWQDLTRRCRDAEPVLRLLGTETLSDTKGMRKVVRELWDRAQWVGGMGDMPPDMPRVKDRVTALQAVRLLLTWIETHQAATGAPPSIDPVAHAMTLLATSSMSIPEIARTVKVNRAAIYRNKKWEPFRTLAERMDKLKPKGRKGTYHRRGSKFDGKIEAIADDETDD